MNFDLFQQEYRRLRPKASPEEARTAWMRENSRVVPALMSGLEAGIYGGVLGPLASLTTMVGLPTEAAEQSLYQKAAEATPEAFRVDITRHPEILKNPGYWAFQTGQVLPSIGASLLPAGAAGTAAKMLGAGEKGIRTAQMVSGLGAGSALEAGGFYHETRDPLKSLLYGAGVAGTEVLPFSRMLNLLGGKYAGGLVPSLLKTAAAESAQEWSEEPLSALIKGEPVMEAMRQGLNVVPGTFAATLLTGGLGAGANTLQRRIRAPRSAASQTPGQTTYSPNITPAAAVAEPASEYPGKSLMDELGLPPPEETLPADDPLLVETIQKPGREPIQEQILGTFLQGHKPAEGQPVAILMGGGGASGKGFILKRLREAGVIPEDAVTINPDDMKEAIPEYQQLLKKGDWRAALVSHEESSLLAKKLQDQAASGHYNLIIDKTLGNPEKALKTIQDLKTRGYRVKLYGVTTDIQTAMKQMADRAKRSGRNVLIPAMLQAHKGFANGFESLAGLADEAYLIDNRGPRQTVVASRTPDGGIAILDPELYNEFVAKKEINPNAGRLEEITAGAGQRGRRSAQSQGISEPGAEAGRRVPEEVRAEPPAGAVPEQRLNELGQVFTLPKGKKIQYKHLKTYYNPKQNGRADVWTRQPIPDPDVRALRQRVRHVQVGKLPHGLDSVNTPAEAASLFAPLRKKAQEQLMALVTDRNGVPLAVIRNTIGQRTSASAAVGSLVGMVHNIPGAAQVWFAHNHPSGNPTQSSADRTLTVAMQNLLKNTGIQPRDMIVVAPDTNSYTHFSPEDGVSSLPEPIQPQIRDRATPLLERELTPKERVTPETIENPDTAALVAQKVSGGRDGVMLLDNRHGVLDFLPMTREEMATPAGFAKIMAGTEVTNAAAVIGVVNSGIKGSERRGIKENLERLNATSEIRSLDLMEGTSDGLISWAQHGLMEPETPYATSGTFSRGARVRMKPGFKLNVAGEVMQTELRDGEPYIQLQDGKWWRAADFEPAGVAEPTGDTPESVQQVDQNGIKAAIETQRRGVQTWEASQQLADELGVDAERVDKILRRKLGEAYNAEQILNVKDNVENRLVDLFNTVQPLAQKAVEGTLTDAERVEFDAKELELGALISEMYGVRAESGRALNIFKKLQTTLGKAEALQEYLSSRGGQDLIDARIQMLAQLDLTTLDGRRAAAKAASMAHKVTAWDMLVEYYKAMLLTGPPTHVVNIVGNETRNYLEAVDEFMTAAVGKLTGSADRRTFKAASEFVRAHIGGLRLGAQEAAKVRLLGTTDSRKAEIYKEAIPGKLGKVIRIPFQLLSKMDALQRTAAYYQALRMEAVQRGLDPDHVVEAPPADLRKIAERKAEKLIFTEPGGPIVNALNQARARVPALNFIFPFLKTPANIVRDALHHTPGVAMLFSDTRAEWEQGGRARDAVIARQAVGAVLGGTVWALAAAGMLTGSPPDDPSERRMWELKGIQPFSIRIGDTWYAYNRLDPIGILVGLAADAWTFKERLGTDDASKLAALVMGSISTNLTNKTYLSGLSDLISAMQDPAQHMGRALRRFAGSLIVPTGVAYIARASDPYLREARTVMDAIKARTPGLSQTLVPRLDVTGRERQREGGPVYTLTSPAWKKTQRPDPVADELMRLDVSFPYPSRKFRGVELTPALHNELVKTLGKPTYKVLQRVVRSKNYQQMPAPIKKWVLEKVISAVRRNARLYWSVRHPEILQAARDKELQLYLSQGGGS